MRRKAMTSHEARIGEAVASLTARLNSWGVDEPTQKAHDFVRDMLRNGWRPTAAYVEPTPTNPRPIDPDRARQLAAEAREAIRAARYVEPVPADD